MEDKGAYVFFNKFKWIFIAVIASLLVGIISFIIYNNYMTNKNTNTLTKYLLKNDFKKNSDGTYVKNVSDDNISIQYLYTERSSSITKDITETNINDTATISLEYKSIGIVDGTLQRIGLNNNKKYGSLLLSGNLNVKNSDFKCKIISNQAFTIECNRLKKEIETFTNEIKKWSKDANIKIKYIK